MIEYKDYHFEDNKLFLGTKDTGMFYSTHDDYPGEFWINWRTPAGSVLTSETFYNLSRVKDNMRVWHLRELNRSAEKQAGEGSLMRLNEVPATLVAKDIQNSPVSF